MQVYFGIRYWTDRQHCKLHCVEPMSGTNLGSSSPFVWIFSPIKLSFKLGLYIEQWWYFCWSQSESSDLPVLHPDIFVCPGSAFHMHCWYFITSLDVPACRVLCCQPSGCLCQSTGWSTDIVCVTVTVQLSHGLYLPVREGLHRLWWWLHLFGRIG